MPQWSLLAACSPSLRSHAIDESHANNDALFVASTIGSPGTVAGRLALDLGTSRHEIDQVTLITARQSAAGALSREDVAAFEAHAKNSHVDLALECVFADDSEVHRRGRNRVNHHRSGSAGTAAGPLRSERSRDDASTRLVELREPVFGLATAASICRNCLERKNADVDQVLALLKEMIITSERAVAILKR